MTADATVYPTVVHMLQAAAEAVPEREAVVQDDRRLDYRTYVECVAAFAGELREMDVASERVALILPNGLEACIATFAVHAAGAQAVPLNPLYTEREVTEILTDAEPKLLLHDAHFPGAEALADKLSIPFRLALGTGTRNLTDERDQSLSKTQFLPAPDGLALLLYTGGTTGRAKGVELSHRAIAANVAQREGLLPTSRNGECILCVMPLFHSYALSMGLYLAANCGGTLVARPRYQPDDVLATVERERITIFPGSPTIYNGLLAHPNFAAADWSHLHTCYSGSAPLSEETLRRWEEAVGAPVYEGYGQTEAGPVLTFNPVGGKRLPGSVGIPLSDTTVQIVDVETGTKILGPGEAGEIRARGPQIMNGYHNRPEETAAALRGGWLYTGDIGEFDDDGYLYIRDRKKDMVIVGGYNVFPREVDEVLYLHPEIVEAAAVGGPDFYRGEVIRAFVTLSDGATVSVGALGEHCATNLARYKCPASIDVLDALPKTGVGKIDKKALRERVLRIYGEATNE